MSVDPETVQSVGTAIALGKVAGDVAKKALVDPVLDSVAAPIREWATKHITPKARRVLGLDEAAALAREETAKRLAGVAPERLVEPDPAVVAGTIEALQTRHELPELRDLFAQLLASSMDGTTADAAHPSFVDIIRQLSVDDARVFRAMERQAPYHYLTGAIPREIQADADGLREDMRLAAWRLLAADADVGSPLRAAYALTNLERVGLVERHVETVTALNGPPKPVRAYVDVSPFGRRFAVACLGAPAPTGLPAEWSAERPPRATPARPPVPDGL